MVQLLQNLADEFADFAQGMVRGNPLLRMNVRKHPALILRPSAHLQSSRRIRGGLNHHSFALARFFSKLLDQRPTAVDNQHLSGAIGLLHQIEIGLSDLLRLTHVSYGKLLPSLLEENFAI